MSELNYAQSQGTDEHVEKMEDFAKIIYENLDSISQEEIAICLSRLFETVQMSKKGQSALLNQMILNLNDVFDAYNPPKMNQALRDRFISTLTEMEKMFKNNIHSLSMETLTNAAYYYCKFQAGSNDFWDAIENQIIKSRDSLTIEQLSKIILAFTMNKRQF